MRQLPKNVIGVGAVAVLALAWATHRIVTTLHDADGDWTPPAAASGAAHADRLREVDPSKEIRCAVIGGMTFTGFWSALGQRYQQETGVTLRVLSTGEKDEIATAFRAGAIDVITMHASDTIVNLVADGYALDPQPWMRNDLVIVGPVSDPAGIRGMSDAAAALRKIVSAQAPFVIHSSLGAQEVLRNICNNNRITLDAARTTILLDDPQRQVLSIALAKGAYTMVGRIPFRMGRLPSQHMAIMVEGDPSLRRPYVVAVANPARIAGVRFTAAQRFAHFLRDPATQQWISRYGRGVIDDQPLFFPVQVPKAR